MFRLRATIFIFIFFLSGNQVFSQLTSEAQIDTGRIDGAIYRIVIPENWNHNLVMYAHGYESPSMVHTPERFHNPVADRSVQPFLDRGFAVARSAYRKTGFALAEGVEDTEALRQYFVNTYGQPDTTYITGHSMGGGITLATIENFPQYYQGALPMCPLASRPYMQVKVAFDINAVFGAFYPGVLPPLADVLNGTAPSLSQAAIQQAVQQDTALADQIARRFEYQRKDLAMIVMFNDGVLRDIGQQAGGNPFDNRNTLYTGFPDDWELNQKVERLAVDPGTEWFLNQYDRTGKINRPVGDTAYHLRPTHFSHHGCREL